MTPSREQSEIYVGNADVDAPGDQGWLLGYFKSPDDPRHSTDVEIKWGRHPKGDRRAQWVRGEERTALLMLISGRFHVELPDRTVVLTTPGDYVLWGPGTDHSWIAEEPSVVVTVRWPSLPGYAVPKSEAGAVPETEAGAVPETEAGRESHAGRSETEAITHSGAS